MMKRVREVFGHYERVPQVAEIQSRKRSLRAIRKSYFAKRSEDVDWSVGFRLIGVALEEAPILR
jgi:hypothetical protein